MEELGFESRFVWPRTCALTHSALLFYSSARVLWGASIFLRGWSAFQERPNPLLFALSGTWAPYDGQHLPTSHFEAQVLDAQITRILVRCPRHLELSQLLKPGHLGVHIDLWGNIVRFLRELSAQRVSATSSHLYIGYTTGWGAHAQVLSSMSLAPLPRPCAENLKLLFPSLKLRHGKQVQQQNRKENTT